MRWLSLLRKASLLLCLCLHLSSSLPIGLTRRGRARLQRRSSGGAWDDESLTAAAADSSAEQIDTALLLLGGGRVRPSSATGHHHLHRQQPEQSDVLVTDEIVRPAHRDVEIETQPVHPTFDGAFSWFEEREWNVDAVLEASDVHRSITLECAIRAERGTATIHWLFSRVPGSEEKERILQGGSDLSVLNEDVTLETSTSPDGQVTVVRSRLRLGCLDASALGEYVCVAQTPTERKSVARLVSATDDFLALAEMRSSHACEPDASATIYMYKETHMDEPGGTAQLLCRAAGFPQPEITWYFEGNAEPVLLATDDKYQILSNGDLLIRDLTLPDSDVGDSGIYRCVAQNEFTSANVTVDLYVFSPSS